jgi:membrane-associated phospholipid phosphatase
MESVWDWGNRIIVVIQQLHTPALDSLFNAITALGDAEFMLLFLALIIWSVNQSTGRRLVYLLFISIALNTWAKLTIAHPRPFGWPTPDTSPVLKLNNQAEGYGLPSGHTQNALVLWFYLADKFRQNWAWPLALILFSLIAFSRLYLGVHFPTDLLGGALLGGTLLLAFIRFEPHATRALPQLSLPGQTILAIMLPLIIIMLHPHPHTIATLSILSGFSLGVLFEEKQVNLLPAGSIKQRAIRYAAGLTSLLLIFALLKIIIPAPEFALYLPLSGFRLAIVGFWMSGGAPWLFKKMEQRSRA